VGAKSETVFLGGLLLISKRKRGDFRQAFKGSKNLEGKGKKI